MKLSTTYLGLTLEHPFIAGASPLADNLDTAVRLEAGGAAAIVMRSLFEEQISLAETGRIHQMDPFDKQFADALAGFPPPHRYALAPDAYAEHVHRLKDAVRIPVIASLNGMTSQSWLKFAEKLEQAGADAIELNMYEMPGEGRESSAAIETQIRNTVLDVKRAVKIPIALKLTPYFTSFGYFAQQIDRAGVDGLVLFNRFFQPDIDIDRMLALPRMELSSNAELLVRLRWLATLHARLRCSLAVTGGVATATDGIKAILVGADAVQMVSAILRHGPGYFSVMREGLLRWMESKRFGSIDDVRGRIDAAGAHADLAARGDYISTLQSWA